MSIFNYWGKTAEDGSYHLLPYHCLDVAAMVAVWWDSSATIRRSFCRNCDEKQIRAWLLFFCALHDYGKFDLRFQLKAPAFKSLYPYPAGTLPSEKEIKGYWHGEAGLYWFRKDYIQLFGCADSGGGLFFDEVEPEQWISWKPWIEAVTGHHGHLKNADYAISAEFSSTVDSRYRDVDLSARVAWQNVLAELFLSPAGLSLSSEPPEPSPMLAGLCSVADWLGSRCDVQNFSFHSQPKEPEAYFNQKSANDGGRVLEMSGIIGRSKPFSGVTALLPEGKSPRPLQVLTEMLPKEPALTIIEAPTGTGKTEAALAHAWKLIDAELADSIIFALPTQATTNAMFDRLKKAATILFSASPNLLLAHGYARFNEKFADLKKYSNHAEGDEQDGWVKCSEWLAESRKRVFFGQIGVCTVDQILISVLPVRHRFVRGFGVGRSVLIVDEVHAYDAYMYGLLEEVLRQQKNSVGSAILLSATLPAEQKQKLFAAWNAEVTNAEELLPYPLISSAAAHEVVPYSLPEAADQEIVTVNVESLRSQDMTPDNDLISRIIKAAEKGAQVAIICNLVDVAQSLYEQLKLQTEGLPIEVDLFHARFRFLDRQGKEKGVINSFGLGGDRNKGRILVATQVVEQSLDIDFDWIITQLCPVDLLFQRMGRLHRHENNNDKRPPGFTEPLCSVLVPTDGDYGGTGVVYANNRVLWRTEQMLIDVEQVVFPAAYRDWIEAVYQEDSWDDEPELVTEAYREFKDEIESVKRFMAQQIVNMAKDMTPFTDSDQSITAVTRDGEMSLTLIPYIEATNGRQTIDGDLLDQLDEYQLNETLALNSVSVPGSNAWKYSLDDIAEVDKNRYWLKMQPDGSGFITEGKKVIFRYHSDTGLRREKR